MFTLGAHPHKFDIYLIERPVPQVVGTRGTEYVVRICRPTLKRSSLAVVNPALPCAAIWLIRVLLPPAAHQQNRGQIEVNLFTPQLHTTHFRTFPPPPRSF